MTSQAELRSKKKRQPLYKLTGANSSLFICLIFVRSRFPDQVPQLDTVIHYTSEQIKTDTFKPDRLYKKDEQKFKRASYLSNHKTPL
jgi:hypothetical protein